MTHAIAGKQHYCSASSELRGYEEQRLWSRDLMGYSFEHSNTSVLEDNGFSKFIVFHNSTDPRRWKRQKGKGVDRVLKIGPYSLYTEDSFCSKNYPYRRRWFEKCRVPRFHSYPSDRFHLHILLTNRPHNFDSVKTLARKFYIRIMDLDKYLMLIRRLLCWVTCSSLSSRSSSGSNSSVSSNSKQVNTKQIKHVYAYETDEGKKRPNSAKELLFSLLTAKATGFG